jgi:hypothetical protein
MIMDKMYIVLALLMLNGNATDTHTKVQQQQQQPPPPPPPTSILYFWKLLLLERLKLTT